MGRREFIALLGGAAVAWPRGAGAADDKLRRIGVLDHPQRESDLAAAHDAFHRRFDDLGLRLLTSRAWSADQNEYL